MTGFFQDFGYQAFKEQAPGVAFVTATFWAAQTVFQRLAGALKFHSGRSSLVLSGLGAASCLASCKIAMDSKGYLERQLLPSFTSPPSGSYFPSLASNAVKEPSRKDLVRTLFISSLLYVGLEGKLFQTAFPSSIISTGVFSRGMRGSVAATGELRTFNCIIYHSLIFFVLFVFCLSLVLVYLCIEFMCLLFTRRYSNRVSTECNSEVRKTLRLPSL